jgi:uncharacterized protein YdeI (YjbR/CyaY-like superfamily)
MATKKPVKKRKAPSRRPRNAMPAFIRRALAARGVSDAYRARPPYQRNDYVGWITRAKRESTRDKRLQQMLTELETGSLYMNMKWDPTRTRG